MLDFERKYNKEREDDNKRVVCFACHKEGHTIQNCFKLFPHLKNKDGEGKQDRRPRQKKDGYKGKKKAKAMQALWSADSDESEDDESDTESGNEQEANLALMATVDEKLTILDVDSIIASKNITDDTTIEFLKEMAKSRNKKEDSNNMGEASTSHH